MANICWYPPSSRVLLCRQRSLMDCPHHGWHKRRDELMGNPQPVRQRVVGVAQARGDQQGKAVPIIRSLRLESTTDMENLTIHEWSANSDQESKGHGCQCLRSHRGGLAGRGLG